MGVVHPDVTVNKGRREVAVILDHVVDHDPVVAGRAAVDDQRRQDDRR